MQRSPHLNRQVRKPTTIPHHPANPSRGSAPRRSQRLLLQKTSNYSSSDDFSGRDVVRNIRAEVFRAAAIFDLISCGNHPDPRTAMRSGERKRVLDDDGEEGEVFELVPKENWVFSTPTQQRIERPKPKESQMVPALLHTTSKYKTLYEMGEGPSAKIMRQNVVESDVGCFRRMARFHINHGEALLQTSLVTEKVSAQRFCFVVYGVSAVFYFCETPLEEKKTVLLVQQQQ